jgi:hypothetical protein
MAAGIAHSSRGSRLTLGRASGWSPTALAAGLAALIYVAVEASLVGRFPLFFDESLFAAEVQSFVDHPTRFTAFIAVADNHGPLQRWLGAAGVWSGLDSITALRMVSIAGGVLTIAAAAAIARRVGRGASVVAAFTAALLPALVVHGSVGIADPLATGILAVAVLLLLRLAERPTLTRGLAAGGAIFLAVLAKKTGLAALALAPFTGLVLRHAWPPGERPVRRWVAACGLALSGGVLAYATLLLAPDSLRRLGPLSARMQYRDVGGVLSDFPHQLSDSLPAFSRALVDYATAPLLVAAALGLVAIARRRSDLAVLLGVWAIGPFAAAVLAAVSPYPRYLLTAFVPLAVLAGAGLVEVARFLAPLPRGRIAAAVVVAASFVPALSFDARVVRSPSTAHYPGLDEWQFVSGFPAGTPWPRLARALERVAASEPHGVVRVAWGGRGVGPVGLAAYLGRPVLAEQSVSAVRFSGRTPDGRRFDFVPYREEPDVDLIVAQDVEQFRPPANVLQSYRVLEVVKRPHDGTSVALLKRR